MKRYLMIIMLAIMVTFCISCGKEPGNTERFSCIISYMT